VRSQTIQTSHLRQRTPRASLSLREIADPQKPGSAPARRSVACVRHKTEYAALRQDRPTGLIAFIAHIAKSAMYAPPGGEVSPDNADAVIDALLATRSMISHRVDLFNRQSALVRQVLNQIRYMDSPIVRKSRIEGINLLHQLFRSLRPIASPSLAGIQNNAARR
jgi:hypothetical protein